MQGELRKTDEFRIANHRNQLGRGFEAVLEGQAGRSRTRGP